MEFEFRDFLERECKWQAGQKVLLAFSGGLDSVCLAHLFKKSDIDFAIAHANFNLRGKESEEDLIFAQNLAVKMGVTFYSQSFDTIGESKQSGQSIQMSARKLRYDFLEKIRSESLFACIATAHHLDDQTETILLNLERGTGLSGLHGIAARRDKIIRPLMNRVKSDLEKYAKVNGLDWREDSSNQKTAYKRNFLRHRVIAPWKKQQLDLSVGFDKTARQIRQQEKIFQFGLGILLASLTQTKSDGLLYIHKLKLQNSEERQTLLHELLSPCGFTASQQADMIHCLSGQPGRMFYSKTHRLVVDRKFLILTPATEDSFAPVWIDQHAKKAICAGIKLNFQLLKKGGVSIPQNSSNALFDADKIVYPLELRPWKKGDFIYPLGLRRKGRKDRMGKKKVSDLLTDLKLSIPQKEKVLVLVSGGRILWVIGHRTDERFKVGKSTLRTLLVKSKSIGKTNPV